MKKLITLLLALVMVFALCACGSGTAETSVPAEKTEETEPAGTDTAETVTAEPAAAEVSSGTGAKVVETGSGITVMTADQWADKYPDIYASYMKNQENESTTDYVEDYPMIGVLYEGMAFNTYYDSARGHAYTITDITNTGRPHKLANCFTCKTPDFTVMVNNEGDSAYSKAFEDAAAEISEPISCYNCHANEPGDLTVTHTYLADAMGEDFTSVDPADLSCGQCHVEYYFDPATKATTLPYTSLDTMTPDAMLDFYNNRLVTDGQSFADYTNPRTGVRQIKVQHPEYETFMGEGSVHKDMFTCADCHMETLKNENGETYKSHYLVSPLESETIMETCARCHADIKKEVKTLQEDMERRTYAVGYELESLTEKLAAAVAAGTYTDEQLDPVRSLARDAQFYWDFVYVENSEGAHNSTLDNECLDKAEELCNKALTVFAGIEPAGTAEETAEEVTEEVAETADEAAEAPEATESTEETTAETAEKGETVAETEKAAEKPADKPADKPKAKAA